MTVLAGYTYVDVALHLGQPLHAVCRGSCCCYYIQCTDYAESENMQPCHPLSMGVYCPQWQTEGATFQQDWEFWVLYNVPLQAGLYQPSALAKHSINCERVNTVSARSANHLLAEPPCQCHIWSMTTLQLHHLPHWQADLSQVPFMSLVYAYTLPMLGMSLPATNDQIQL